MSSTLCSLIFMSTPACAFDASRSEKRLLNSNHIIFNNLVEEYIDVNKYAFHTFSRHVFLFQKLEIVFKSTPLCSQIIEAGSVSIWLPSGTWLCYQRSQTLTFSTIQNRDQDLIKPVTSSGESLMPWTFQPFCESRKENVVNCSVKACYMSENLIDRSSSQRQHMQPHKKHTSSLVFTAGIGNPS